MGVAHGVRAADEETRKRARAHDGAGRGPGYASSGQAGSRSCPDGCQHSTAVLLAPPQNIISVTPTFYFIALVNSATEVKMFINSLHTLEALKCIMTYNRPVNKCRLA